MYFMTKVDHKVGNRFMLVSMTFFSVLFLARIVYDSWDFDRFVGNVFMMKTTLITLGFAGLYVDFAYMRKEQSYKKKRNNVRIKEESRQGIQDYKKELKKVQKSDEIVTALGNSLEKKDTPIIWKGKDMFTHMLVVGATRSGKTASVLEPMIYQLLMQKKQGKKLGLTVVEPKGEFARQIKEFCDEMDIPYIYVDPESEVSHKFNPMEGNIDDVVEGTVIVLRGLFGKQDAFFANVQELAARNVTRLLKELKGDKVDLIEVLETLRDLNLLTNRTKELRRLKGETDLVHSIEHELLGTMAEKYKQFVIGLRAQLENITSNDLLKKIMAGKSDINIDEHLANDGVLIVNTALGTLKKAGDAFGQFLIMHLQNGTFRRPGTEDTRTPHYMVIDEYKRYINPQVEIFLSLAASYKVSGILATQSLGQLEVEAGDIGPRAMKQAIMTNCRNKLCFNGTGYNDAQEFADEFGKDKVMIRQATYKNRILLPNMFPDSYRDTEGEEYRFDPTDIMDALPKYSYINKMMYEAAMQRPNIARGNLVPKDWKELREWEDNRFSIRLREKVKRAGTVNQIRQLAKKRKGKEPQHEAIPTTEIIGEKLEDVSKEYVETEHDSRPTSQPNQFIQQQLEEKHTTTKDERKERIRLDALDRDDTAGNTGEIEPAKRGQTKQQPSSTIQEEARITSKPKEQTSVDDFW